MRKLFAALMLTAAISAAASGEEGGFVKSDFYKTMGKNDRHLFMAILVLLLTTQEKIPLMQ